jgi:hypothetical protein
MAQPAGVDFSDVFAQASQAASEQEAQREMLLGRVTTRAAREPEFRRTLETNPEQALAAEAERLNVPVTAEAVQQARTLFSPTLPDLKEDEVGKLVLKTVEDMRTSFTLTLTLARVLFVAGLAMTAIAFVVGVFAQGKEWLTGLFGAGGLVTLITYVIMNPLDRIRAAASNLVQVQIAYISYYKQLNLLSPGGQERLSRDDTIRFARELRESAVAMISAVQTILGTGKPPSSAPAVPAPTTSAGHAPPPTPSPPAN